MPTVYRLDSLKVVISHNDPRPAYVHVIGPEGEAVFELNCPAGPPSLCESLGFRLAELNKIQAVLVGVLASLSANWRSIHGTY